MATTGIKDSYQGGSDNGLKVNSDGSIDTDTTATIVGDVDVNLNGLNSFQTSQYVVGLSPVQITVTPLTHRSSISMKATCTTTNAIYIGPTNSVSTSTGYPLFNGDVINLDLTGMNPIWAVASASGQALYALELAG